MSMVSFSSSSVSSPSKISRVRVSSFTLIHLFFFLLFNNFSIITSFPSSSQISYSQHCNSVVPESIPDDLKTLSPAEFLQLQNGYYLGGDKFLSQNLQSSFNFPKSLAFRTKNLYKTDTEGIYKVEASLIFLGRKRYPFLGNVSYGGGSLRQSRFRNRRPRIPLRRNGLNFRLQGFYSESSGKLCMVGSSSAYSKEGNLLDLSAVFKLNYPNNSNIATSLVSGTLESLDNVNSLSYFEPISVLAFSQRNYNYTLITDKLDSEDSGQEMPSLSLDPRKGICSTLIRSGNAFELDYGTDCDGTKNCNPLGMNFGFLPEFMSFSGIQCSDKRKLRLLIGFSNNSYYGYNQPLVPSNSLVGEGVWDGEKNRLSIFACRILNFTDSLAKASVGDCSIRLTLWFPAILSIKNRNTVIGQLWSNTKPNVTSYFDRVLFQSSENRMLRVPGLKYEYTETGTARKSCVDKNSGKNKGKIYPNGLSNDMKFDMSVKDRKGKYAWGYSVPLTVGDQFYEQSFNLRPMFIIPDSATGNTNQSHIKYLNISYRMSFRPPKDFNVQAKVSSTKLNPDKPVDIAAEGIYDTETGSLCMMGCRYLWAYGKSARSDSMDCNITISIQFPPLNSKGGETITGSIESKRENSDPLYFERLELSSVAMYTSKARESVWRMDLEIIMVLVSNTLTCVFIGLQLFYVKKHPDVVSSISFVMLVILTLGYMIPLVLNFEALFLTNRNRQNVLIGSGGWLEVNEVIVRVVTMVAFLLQFRLLQLTWSTRSSDENQKGLWVSEKNSLRISLPLYIIGGLIALIVHRLNNYYEAPTLYGKIILAHYQKHSLLGDLRSYAGLVLDSFLFPQILLNIFSNTKEKALSPAFYVGTTLVRLLPHTYDLYRAHSYIPNFEYIYANPGVDFFSTAWDVIITVVGLLFASLVFLQQRFGGRCFLPQRFRELSIYQKVPPFDSNEGL